MATIKTENFKIGEKTYVKQMTYRPGGPFQIKVPEEIAVVLQKFLVKGDTEKECDKNFARVVFEFQSLKEKKDRVILYRIDLEALIKDEKGKIIFDRGHFSDSRGIKIGFDYMVANRIRYGDTQSFYDDTGKKVWIGGESIMEWTAEREKFFAGFNQALEGAILRSNEFFKNNSAKLAKLIDSNSGPLLLGGPND